MVACVQQTEPPRSDSNWYSWRSLLWQLLVAAFYLLLARVVHGYFTSTIASVLWPSSGLALAAVLLGGRRYACGVFLGALLTHVIADSSLWTPLPIALGNTLEALAGYWLLNRNSQFNVRLRKLHDYVHLVFWGGCVAGLVGSLIGPVVLLAAGIFTTDNYLLNTLHWWMGDVLGVVLIAPLILVWRKIPAACLEPGRLAEVALLFGLAFIAGQVLYLGWFADTLGSYARGSWAFLFITWAAVRLGMHGVLMLLLMTAIQSLLGAYHHVGLFGSDSLNAEMLHFWQFIVTLSVVGILLASYIRIEKYGKEALREQEEFFRMISENVDDYISVLDLQGRRLYNSPSYARLFGEVEFMNQADSFAEIYPDDRERIRQVFRETVASGLGQRAEFRFVLPDGSVRSMESRGGVIKDKAGKAMRVVVVSHDITERKQVETQIHKLAFYDALTQLPNRRLLADRLTQAMSAGKRSGSYGALIFLDLDNFKPLNDTHGHAMGDVLLIEAAERVSRCVREVDTVARFGGDEFVVVLSELDADKKKAAAEARRVAEKIALVMAEPYRLQYQADGTSTLEVEHRCTASIGCVLFVGRETSYDDVLKCADMAMYQAKKNGRSQICFPDSCPALREDGSIVSTLCHARVCSCARQL